MFRHAKTRGNRPLNWIRGWGCCVLCLAALFDLDIAVRLLEKLHTQSSQSCRPLASEDEEPLDDPLEWLTAGSSVGCRLDRKPSRTALDLQLILAQRPTVRVLVGPPSAVPLQSRAEHSHRNGLGAPLLC